MNYKIVLVIEPSFLRTQRSTACACESIFRYEVCTYLKSHTPAFYVTTASLHATIFSTGIYKMCCVLQSNALRDYFYRLFKWNRLIYSEELILECPVVFGSCAGFLSRAIDSMRTRDRCLFTLHIAAVLIFSAYSLDLCVTDNSGVRCGDGNHVRLTRIQGNEVGALSTYVL